MREKILFDDGWMFFKGDIDSSLPECKGSAYICAKTERRHIGPACKDYTAAPECYDPDTEHKHELWQPVTLPHDYITGTGMDPERNNALGFFKYENAWYIKKFEVDAGDLGRRLTLYFEGVGTHATVWLNGCLLKHSFCGYTPFEVDITDVCRYGQVNHLAVYVETNEHEGWWCEGGGIYRHVWLVKTEAISVDLWGVYVQPKKQEDGSWSVKIETTLRSDANESKGYALRQELFDADGKSVRGIPQLGGQLPAREKAVAIQKTGMEAPHLWSPDEPYLYTLRTTVFSDGRAIDEVSTRFGFRTVTLDPDKGLFVNGKPYYINGVCGHADCGLTGKAVPDNLHRYKVQLLKEMGCNGYRTSHYPQAEVLMDAFDENGFMVMDETRWFESSDEGREQLRALIRRDRNHPCVFFWSIGNEEMCFTQEYGARICASLTAEVRRLDDLRPVMAAVDKPDNCLIYSQNDLIGINYNLKSYDSVRERFPDKAFVGSETCASGTTRGWYFPDDPVRGFCSAYDHESFLGDRENTWKFLKARPYVIGEYQWTGFEYWGEAVWPRICSQSGAIDLFLQKKDAFYQNQSRWLERPMLHLLPHWNFEGMEGQSIRVWAYTTCEEVELFLNGQSLGRKKAERYTHLEWNVLYVPGKLEAVGYADGREAVRDVHETSGAPYRLALHQDTKDVRANGRDIAVLTCTVLDAYGREVPDASPFVSFTTEGDCRIYSTGSDVTDHTPLRTPERRMRAGRIGVAVKLGESGEMKVYAQAAGLKTAFLTLRIG